MKLWIRRVLNLLLWLTTCTLAGTAGVLALRLPHGREGGGMELWGWTRHEWGDFHLWTGVFFLVLVLAHMVMAWPWLKNAAAKKKLWPVLSGLAVGIALAVVLAFGPIQKKSGGEGQDFGMGWRGGWQESTDAP